MSPAPNKPVAEFDFDVAGTTVSGQVVFMRKKIWDTRAGARHAAFIVRDLAEILHAEIANRVIIEHKSADHQTYGAYARRRTPGGFGLIIPPGLPQPEPAAHRDFNGNAYYRDRWHYEKAAQRDPKKRKGILSGKMWKSWIRAISSPVHAKIRFKGSSEVAVASRSGPGAKAAKFQNRGKARQFSRITGKDLVAISDQEYKLCLNYVSEHVSATHFRDALAHRDAFRKKRKKRKSKGKWKRVLSVLNSVKR